MYEKIERDFKGVWIPKEIYLDNNLTILEKIILIEIDSLDINEKGCYASNKYLADFCQCAESKITQAIKKLCDLGYIEIINFDGRKRFLRSRLIKFMRQTNKIYEADSYNLGHININNNIDNNIINNKKENIKRKVFKKPTIEEIQKYCIERKNSINAVAFYDFYESKDWMVGKNKMKDWKACVRTWEQRNKVTKIENKVNVPNWFEKDIQKEKISEEEKNELEEMIKKYE